MDISPFLEPCLPTWHCYEYLTTHICTILLIPNNVLSNKYSKRHVKIQKVWVGNRATKRSGTQNYSSEIQLLIRF